MQFAMILLQSQPDPAQMQHFLMAFLAIFPIIILVGLAIVIVPYCFILKKAGFSPWLALLNAVPLGNLIMLYVPAFAEWKVAPVLQGWPVQPPYPPT